MLPLSGFFSYNLIGNTSPTNNLGDVGVLGSATFEANFTNMQAFSTLSLDIGGSTWDASGFGSIGAGALLPAHQFSGAYSSVIQTTGSFSAPGQGEFAGFFSQPGATTIPGAPSGVGLTYTLGDNDGFGWISGALVFGDPQPTLPPAIGGTP